MSGDLEEEQGGHMDGTEQASNGHKGELRSKRPGTGRYKSVWSL